MQTHSLTETPLRLAPTPRASGERYEFTRALGAIGSACAERRARIDSRAASRLAELREEAQSAAGEALARFIDRASRLGVDASSTLGFLPSRGRFPRAVYKAGHKAVDRALRKMAQDDASAPAHLEKRAQRLEKRAERWARAASIAPRAEIVASARAASASAKRARAEFDLARFASTDARTFDASGWIDAGRAEFGAGGEQSAIDDGATFARVSIARRATRLRALVRKAGAKNGNAMRAARAHLARLDRWEARALALASGQDGAPLAVMSARAGGAGGEVFASLSIADATGRPVAHDGRGTASGTKWAKRKGEARALFGAEFDALARLLAFAGEAERAPRVAPQDEFCARMLARSRQLARL
jgi:hypothetical protein